MREDLMGKADETFTRQQKCTTFLWYSHWKNMYDVYINLPYSHSKERIWCDFIILSIYTYIYKAILRLKMLHHIHCNLHSLHGHQIKSLYNNSTGNYMIKMIWSETFSFFYFISHYIKNFSSFVFKKSFYWSVSVEFFIRAVPETALLPIVMTYKKLRTTETEDPLEFSSVENNWKMHG